MKSKRLGVTWVVLCLTARASNARGADKYWSNPNGGYFSTATNWSGGEQGSVDFAYFQIANTGYDVTITDDTFTRALRVQNDTVRLNVTDGFTYDMGFVNIGASDFRPANLVYEHGSFAACSLGI